MGGGGRRGGRGRGGGREGGYGRRELRPRDRRPEYSPRRRNDYSPRGRSPSSPGRARRPRVEDDDREPTRGNRGPTRGGRVGYGGDRDRPRGGDRSPPPGRRDSSYEERRRGRREDYREDGDLPRHGRRDDYAGVRDLPRDGRGEDYAGVRDLPRDRRREDYERAPYRQERDRYDREDRDASGTYNDPPAYMLPDHPSDLNRPWKESDYLGGPGDPDLTRDSKYVGSPGRRNIFKERELLEDAGMTLRISATESGRTTALYQECRSPPSRAALSPPPSLYPSVPPTDTGFLAGGSAMKAVDSFGAGSTHLLHDDRKFKYGGDYLRDSYVERSRGSERPYSGSRDVLAEEDGADRIYPAADMPIRGDRGTDSRLYSSRGMLVSDLAPLNEIGDSSSSLLVKDRQYRMHSEPDFEPSNGYAMNGLTPHDSVGHGRVLAHRFSGRPLEHVSDHGDGALPDITMQEQFELAPRAGEYDGHEYVRRNPIIDTYVAPEDLRGNVSQNPRHISGSTSLTGLKDERINHHLRLPHRNEDEDSYQGMLHESEHNRQDSYGVHASLHYPPPPRGGSDHYSYSPEFEPIGTARRSARQHKFASFEDGCDLSDREVSPMTSRKRYRSSASRDHEMDMHQPDDGFARRGYYDMVEYDSSPRRMSRSYDMVDVDEARYDMPNNRNVFSRLALPYGIDGEWTDTEQEGHPNSNTLTYGHSKHKPVLQRLSRPVAHSKFGAPSVQGRGKGVLTKSGKKKMRLSRDHFDGGYTSPRNEFVRPNKYRKFSEEDNPNESEMDLEDTPEGEDLHRQKDPPEGSEEFTKQVHEAFLKYTKIINESPASQKKFRDGVKGSLSCCVCGSVARKFPDLEALVSHAYNTRKVGLKTKHLGLHKALCVLIGWNWHVALDTSKSHYSISAEEVNAVKGDLLLWPPVVVIHNSSIAIKTKDTESKIVSIEEIEGVLADIGVPLEKAKVGQANQSVFLVKFQPTISGFQEAMRIHDHFSAKNHGKEQFQEMRGSKGKQAASIDDLHELLYAHIAVAEDLGYLDEGTKKRCVIRSKMDIEAKAEATLNLEP